MLHDSIYDIDNNDIYVNSDGGVDDYDEVNSDVIDNDNISINDGDSVIDDVMLTMMMFILVLMMT